MKRIILLSFLALSMGRSTNAQTAVSEKLSSFEMVMLANIKQLDSASSANSLVTLANSFERIGNAEKTKWQPYYYAAYCYTVMAFMTPDKNAIDALADKAAAYLLKASQLEKSNSEITCLSAMINSCRLMVDPASRFPTMGNEIFTTLGKAKMENAQNPRIYLMEARLQLRIPEAFGGGKQVAKKSAETAVEKFKVFQPADAIAPSWGANQAKSLLDKINAE